MLLISSSIKLVQLRCWWGRGASRWCAKWLDSKAKSPLSGRPRKERLNLDLVVEAARDAHEDCCVRLGKRWTLLKYESRTPSKLSLYVGENKRLKQKVSDLEEELQRVEDEHHLPWCWWSAQLNRSSNGLSGLEMKSTSRKWLENVVMNSWGNWVCWKVILHRWREIVEVFRNDPHFNEKEGNSQQEKRRKGGKGRENGNRNLGCLSCWEPRKGEASENEMRSAKRHCCLCWRQATERLIATLKHFFFHWWYDPKPTLKAFGSKWVESTILKIRGWKGLKSGGVHLRQAGEAGGRGCVCLGDGTSAMGQLPERFCPLRNVSWQNQPFTVRLPWKWNRLNS